MKQTKIFYLLTLVLFMVSTISCEKLLEEKPKATIALGQLDPVLLGQAISGVYEPLARNRGRIWESTVGLVFELMSDYADGGAQQLPRSNYNNLLNAPNDLAATWTTLNEAIGRANLLIANLDISTGLTDAQKKSAYGEAYFVRAIAFTFASRTWGKFPMRLKPILNSNDVALAKSDLPVIYDQIIKDLQFAETALPNTVPAGQAGRATAGAAKTALAEIYLYKGDFQNARLKSKEVMDNKATYGYDLEPSFAVLFSATSPTNKEDVFSIKMSQALTSGSFLASYWADSRAKAAGYCINGNKFGGVMSWTPLISGWDSKDLRKSWSLYNNYLINGVLTDAEVEPGLYDLRIGKYRDISTGSSSDCGNDFYLLRYADVLLIFAEAENKLNGATAAAYEAINQVRRRAYGFPTGTPNVVSDLPAGSTQTQFDDLVFRERGYEFIGECKRWFDMVRTGRVDKQLSAVRALMPNPVRKTTPANFLWALPDVELINNPLAK
jgi:hypothetical protein